MKKTQIVAFLLTSCLSTGWAFTCYATFVKSTCWQAYTVTLTLMDAMQNKPITTLSIPSNTSWVRGEFECTPLQTLQLQATFNPTIWENDVNKIYYGTKFKILPATMSKNTGAWDIPICFDNDFAEVPLPPSATSLCQCNMKSIPPIAPISLEGSAQ